MDPYYNKTKAPPFHNHFLLFFRGIGLSKKEGLFIEYKLNLLSSDIWYYIKHHIKYVLHLMTGSLFADEKEETSTHMAAQEQWQTPKDANNNATSSSSSSSEHYEEKPKENMWDNKSSKNIHEHLTNNNNNNNNDNNQSSSSLLSYHRVSLVHTYNEAKQNGFVAILWWLLKNVELQEPSFKRLVLIHRTLQEGVIAEKLRRAKQASKKISKKVIEKAASIMHMSSSSEMVNEEKKTEEEKEEKKLAMIAESTTEEEKKETKKSSDERIVDELHTVRDKSLLKMPQIKDSIQDESETYNQPIRISYFANIPMADLEIVYPCKRLSLKLFDQIYLTIICFLGICSLLMELFSDYDTWLGSFSAFGFIVLMIRAIIWYRSKEDLYISALNESLNESLISNDINVLLSLSDSLREQELMETMLAYFVLIKHNKQILNYNDLDKLCEQLLREEFGNDVDVEINDAIHKLTRLKLIDIIVDDQNNNQQFIQPKSLNHCLQIIQACWKNFSYTLTFDRIHYQQQQQQQQQQQHQHHYHYQEPIPYHHQEPIPSPSIQLTDVKSEGSSINGYVRVNDD